MILILWKFLLDVFAPLNDLLFFCFLMILFPEPQNSTGHCFNIQNPKQQKGKKALFLKISETNLFWAEKIYE
jgi:hypothetical protein